MLKTIFQKTANGILLYGGKTVSAVQEFIGVETKGRELTPEEIAELRTVFEDSVDFAPIRLKLRKIGLFEFSVAAFTHGNTIYIPSKRLDADSDSIANPLLVHEVTHVWQYQNGGADYMRESLINQFHGWRGAGNRHHAYDYVRGIKEGKTWAQLNPEQQAKLIEDCYVVGLFREPEKKFAPNEIDDFTDFAREAIRQLRNREGAP